MQAEPNSFSWSRHPAIIKKPLQQYRRQKQEVTECIEKFFRAE